MKVATTKTTGETTTSSSTAMVKNRRVGAVRLSQLMYTFGVGSVLDLPNFSAVVAGIDTWDANGMDQHQRVLYEPRLLAAVRHEYGGHVKELRTPPPWLPETPSAFDAWARTGVPVLPFPRWLRCTACGHLGLYDGGAFTFHAAEPYRPARASFTHSLCSKNPKARAVPARVVTACSNGHLDEFPWLEFVHDGPSCTAPRLRMIDGRSTRSTDVTIECLGCKKKNNLNFAFNAQTNTLPLCRGRHAHLRRFDDEPCGLHLEPLLLGASNLWFPVTRSALALPAGSDPLDDLIESLWSELKDVDDAELAAAIKFNKVLAPLRVSGDKAIEAVKARRSKPANASAEPPNLLVPEWRLFTQPQFARATPDFRLREIAPPEGFARWIQRTVLVERLREVIAMIGFTRVGGPDTEDGADTPGPARAPLAADPQRVPWVPAAESRGEGIFIQLPESEVDAWCDRVAGTPRLEALRVAHSNWRTRRELPAAEWPGERFLLLHTLAHALINEVALECGYAAASIRERIYAAEASGPNNPAMAGILLYTAAPDSEGTLGGLVSLGEPETLGRILRRALERAELCSTDPMCADHTPAETEDTLHNAACHACVLLPETSCEKGNRFLDRAVLTTTLAGVDVHYFR
ncbi:MAG TPA: DUF1998 domain-containing protein [Gemmatimonadaceae bacterium]